MIKSIKHLAATALLLACGVARADLFINEVYVNPPDGDDEREYIEIISTDPENDSLEDVWVIGLEGDSNNDRGQVDFAIDLSGYTLTDNGNGFAFLLIGEDYESSDPWGVPGSTTMVDFNQGDNPDRLENGAVSILLVPGFTGDVGDQLDPNAINNGEDYSDLDSTPWSGVLDSVGWTDNDSTDAVYTIDGHPGLTQSSGTLDACSRYPDDFTPNEHSAWYNGDMTSSGSTTSYHSTKHSSPFPSGAHITPGDENDG